MKMFKLSSFFLVTFAIAMMSGLVSSHPLTEQEKQNLFKNPQEQVPQIQRNEFSYEQMPQNPENTFPNNPIPQIPNYPFPREQIPQIPNYPFPKGQIPQIPNYQFPQIPNYPFPQGQTPQNPNYPPYSNRWFNYWLTPPNLRGAQSCDRSPKVCKSKGSAGPDCCGKQCVNLTEDSFNCGKCGKMCRFGQMCCGGKCVEVMYNQGNCGSCDNKCKKGAFCNFGLCDYAN